MTRLECCRPMAYDGASQTLVHGPTCSTPDQLLTDDEYSRWRGEGRARAAEFNRMAEEAALARAASRAIHPAGKARHRRLRIVNCTCAHPMQVCGMHKGEL